MASTLLTCIMPSVVTRATGRQTACTGTASCIGPSPACCWIMFVMPGTSNYRCQTVWVIHRLWMNRCHASKCPAICSTTLVPTSELMAAATRTATMIAFDFLDDKIKIQRFMHQMSISRLIILMSSQLISFRLTTVTILGKILVRIGILVSVVFVNLAATLQPDDDHASHA